MGPISLLNRDFKTNFHISLVILRAESYTESHIKRTKAIATSPLTCNIKEVGGWGVPYEEFENSCLTFIASQKVDLYTEFHKNRTKTTSARLSTVWRQFFFYCRLLFPEVENHRII